jgi:hypothetical protein
VIAQICYFFDAGERIGTHSSDIQLVCISCAGVLVHYMAACSSIMKRSRVQESKLLVPSMQQLLAVSMLVSLLGAVSFHQVSAGGYTGDTYWNPAHATFYGGADASGTQGESFRHRFFKAL